jgi:hypothetical protein
MSRKWHFEGDGGAKKSVIVTSFESIGHEFPKLVNTDERLLQVHHCHPLVVCFFSFIGMIKYACCIGWLFDLFACNQYRLMYTEQSVSYVDCVKLAGQYMHSLCMVSNYYDPFDNLIKSSGCP